MRGKIKFAFLLFFLILSSGCQSLGAGTNHSSIFPTPFQETLESDKTRADHPATQAPTTSIPPAQQSNANVPAPTETQLTTTQIFPQATPPYQAKYPEMVEKIDQIITQSGGRWHIIIKEVDGITFYSLLTEQRINIASVVKVPLALLFFAALAENGVSEYQLLEYIQSTGTGGRTFDQLLSAMLVKSEEDATDILAAYISANINVPAQLREWQLESIDLEARRYTAEGVAALFERFYQGEFVSHTAQKLILGYLSEYTPSDDGRIGILRTVAPESYQIYNKRGSLLTPYVVADSAIFENPNGNDYIITIFAYNSEPETTYETLDQAIGEIVLAFWETLETQHHP